jgi:hypothetical protein
MQDALVQPRVRLASSKNSIGRNEADLFNAYQQRTVEDVAPNGYSLARAMVRQRKTGRPVRFELTEQTRQAVDDLPQSDRQGAGRISVHQSPAGRRGHGRNGSFSFDLQ